ncbi:MAG: hypothetical protein K0S34_465 [Bacillales bacterium]|nr:hypothetical protein [Bacillales bacterium]
MEYKFELLYKHGFGEEIRLGNFKNYLIPIKVKEKKDSPELEAYKALRRKHYAELREREQNRGKLIDMNTLLK